MTCQPLPDFHNLKKFTAPHTLPLSHFTTSQMEKELSRLRTNKENGPNNISPSVLKACAPAGVFQHHLNLSLRFDEGAQSMGRPVLKNGHPSILNDYRYVALMSHVMRTFQMLVLRHLRTLITAFLDPLQFAYKPHIGVEDVIIFLMHRALSHLERQEAL